VTGGAETATTGYRSPGGIGPQTHHHTSPNSLTELPMNLNDTARVRQPRDGSEYRLATITDITYSTPHTTHIRHLQLRFPTGEHRTYTPADIVACTRTEDHAALVAAFTDACRALRDACRIAHDYDERINTDIIGLLLAIHGTVAARLGVTLDPAHLDPPANIDQVTS
jgi:hypothetical protein